MKNQFVKSFIPAGLILLFSGLCSNVVSQNAGGAVKLAYKYQSDKAISYKINSTMVQVMDIQGQTMQNDVASAFGCSVKSTGNQDNNLKLEITIDTLGQTANSPMGVAGGAAQGIKGKTCNMVIAPDGRIVDASGAASIVFRIEGSGESDMTQTFSGFFPLLPSKPVTVGETWNLTDSVSTKTTSTTMKNVDISVNKLEGFETVNGIECAKISSQHSGTMIIITQNQGMDIIIKGPYEGKSECLFAVKEGYFIRQTVTTRMKGNLEITSPESMSFPTVIDIKAVNEVK